MYELLLGEGLFFMIQFMLFQIEVGEIVKVCDDEFFPADLALISSR